LAADCPDNCCTHNWNIPVEREMIEKWKSISDLDLKHDMLESVIEKQISDEVEYFIGVKNQQCSLQDEQGLCIIHSRLGPDYLGSTCREYPRGNQLFENYSLKGAAMSCPEIAQMIVEYEKNKSIFDLDGSLAAIEEPARSINEFLDKVMSKNDSSIAAKIITISRFLTEISLLAQSGQLDLQRLQTLSHNFDGPLKDIDCDIKSKYIRVNSETGGFFWNMVYRMITAKANYKKDERIQSHPVITKLSNDNMTADIARELYEEIAILRLNSSQVLQKLMPGIGERYLSIKFMSSGFPLAPIADNYIAAFLFGILPYCFINLNLWILYDVNKSLTKQDLIHAIYNTERVVSHTQRIYKAILANQAMLRIDKFDVCFSDLF